MPRKRYLALFAALLGAGVLTIGVLVATAGTSGNGAPSGPHFTLNIHGVNGGQGYNGNTKNNIFVPLQGNCKIGLTMGPFSVLQNDCINDPPAQFQLPNPCGDTNTTCEDFVYAVYARALAGKGSADMFSCFTDKTTGDTFCATGLMVMVILFTPSGSTKALLSPQEKGRRNARSITGRCSGPSSRRPSYP